MDGAKAAVAAGISYRQFDHWCRRGYLPGAGQAPGSGNVRTLATDQVGHLEIMASLVRAGLTPKVAAELAADLEGHPEGVSWRLPVTRGDATLVLRAYWDEPPWKTEEQIE